MLKFAVAFAAAVSLQEAEELPKDELVQAEEEPVDNQEVEEATEEPEDDQEVDLEDAPQEDQEGDDQDLVEEQEEAFVLKYQRLYGAWGHKKSVKGCRNKYAYRKVLFRRFGKILSTHKRFRRCYNLKYERVCRDDHRYRHRAYKICTPVLIKNWFWVRMQR